MKTLIEKLVDEGKITDKDIENELYEICDREHASCNNECPVYDDVSNEIEELGECRFHKNGKKMLEHLRK